jgi:tRNA pseudouridine55 synthase
MAKRRSRKHRLPPFEHSGILLVDKPKGWTSHDVVNLVKCRFNVKVGHCGTLDPAASGLLVLVLGKATKLSSDLSGFDKVYEGTVLFGLETDSQDMDGEVIAEKDTSSLTQEDVLEVFNSFLGEQEQIPPMYSAVKKDGKKLYELAREGKVIEREPRRINISLLEVLKFYLPKADFRVKCSKGTFIRTLCSDIGKKLNTGAVLFDLRRTASGEFDIEDAFSVEEIKTWTQDDLFEAVKKCTSF